MNFFQFFYVYKKRVKKNWGYNRKTVSSMTRKILVCDEEPCQKTYSFWEINEKISVEKKDRKNSFGF